jgi:DNA-binding response OmpR family regulator
MQAKRVLLVDDEPLVRRSLEKTLLRAGYEVETAPNVSDAFATFEKFEKENTPFDIAILDINMPDFNGIEKSGAGLELLSKIVEKRAGIPVIMLTAYDEVNKAKEAVNRGAKAYFVKGREQGLVEIIRGILES